MTISIEIKMPRNWSQEVDIWELSAAIEEEIGSMQEVSASWMAGDWLKLRGSRRKVSKALTFLWQSGEITDARLKEAREDLRKQVKR